MWLIEAVKETAKLPASGISVADLEAALDGARSAEMACVNDAGPKQQRRVAGGDRAYGSPLAVHQSAHMLAGHAAVQWVRNGGARPGGKEPRLHLSLFAPSCKQLARRIALQSVRNRATTATTILRDRGGFEGLILTTKGASAQS
jgi:hypothetical protein